MKNNWILAVVLVFPLQLLAAPPVEEGKSIFLSRCAACHNVNKQLTGPALAGVDERRPIEWIINFVHSSQSMIKKGDQYAVSLFEKFNKVPMPDHTDLSPDHIKSIVEYIKSETKAVSTTPMNKPPVKKAGFVPLSLQKHWPFFVIYIGVVLMLVVVLAYAVKVNSIRNQREGVVG